LEITGNKLSYNAGKVVAVLSNKKSFQDKVVQENPPLSCSVEWKILDHYILKQKMSMFA
jgi:hypothetical protein